MSEAYSLLKAKLLGLLFDYPPKFAPIQLICRKTPAKKVLALRIERQSNREKGD